MISVLALQTDDFFEADGLEVILEDWEGSELQRMHYWKIWKDYGLGRISGSRKINLRLYHQILVQRWEAKQQTIGLARKGWIWDLDDLGGCQFATTSNDHKFQLAN